MRRDDMLPIGEVAARSGLTSSAIRFYEAEGLISSTRSPAGQRRFARHTLRRLAFIRAAQRVGLSLADVAAVAQHAPRRPSAHQGRMGEALSHVAPSSRRTHRRPRASARRSHRLHRLRLPLAHLVPSVQPRRRSRRQRFRPSVPPGRRPRRLHRTAHVTDLPSRGTRARSRRQPSLPRQPTFDVADLPVWAQAPTESRDRWVANLRLPIKPMDRSMPDAGALRRMQPPAALTGKRRRRQAPTPTE